MLDRSATMIAQTFLDLYRELKLRHYRTQDLELIFHAHELAARIFSGSYRPTYKPFICHLVGTASILGKCGERRELIAAALLHSAYSLGAFGDRTSEITKQKRRVVSQWVGVETEGLVYQYSIADWSIFERLDGEVGNRQGVERELLALKLADLFDDISDNTMKIVPKKGMVMDPSHGALFRAKVVACASRTLGPTIAAEFESLFDEIEREDIDDFLISQRTSSFFEQRKPLTFFPASHRAPSSDRVQLSGRLPQFDAQQTFGPRCCVSASLAFALSKKQFPWPPRVA
jgi:hypothetical protein